MEGFFNAKMLLRLFAAAIVLAAGIVLVSEALENNQTPQVAEVHEVTRLVEQTVLVTQIVEQVVTVPATAETQPTATHTTTPAASSTPDALAVLPDGISIWCKPLSESGHIEIPVTGQTAEDAVYAEKEDDTLVVYTQVQSCTFQVAFNQSIPEGLFLQVKDKNPLPFVDEALTPLEDDPTVGYVHLTHHFIVDPPYWKISYTVSVNTSEGENLWNEAVIFKRRWQPQACPDGNYPDPVTMQCPNPQGE